MPCSPGHNYFGSWKALIFLSITKMLWRFNSYLTGFLRLKRTSKKKIRTKSHREVKGTWFLTAPCCIGLSMDPLLPDCWKDRSTETIVCRLWLRACYHSTRVHKKKKKILVFHRFKIVDNRAPKIHLKPRFPSHPIENLVWKFFSLFVALSFVL